MLETKEESTQQKTTKSKTSKINLSLVFVVIFVMLLIIPYFIDQNIEYNIERDISTTDYIIEVISYIISTHICYYVGCFVFILLVILLFAFGFIGNAEIISNTYNNQLTIKKLNNEIQELKKLQEQKETEKQKIIKKPDKIGELNSEDQSKINGINDEIQELKKLHEQKEVEKQKMINQIKEQIKKLEYADFDTKEPEIKDIENKIKSISSEKSTELQNETLELTNKLNKSTEQIKDFNHQLEFISSEKSNLENQIKSLNKKIIPNDLLQKVFSSKKTVISTDSSLDGLSIVGAIEQYFDMEIKSYKFLYDFRLEMNANFHNLVDGKPYPTTVIQTENRLIIGISNQAFIHKQKEEVKDKGMLITIDISNDKKLDNIFIFTLKTSEFKNNGVPLITHNSIQWYESHLVYGNFEISIRKGENTITSYFGKSSNHYKTIINGKQYNSQDFWGNKGRDFPISMIGCQVFSLIVE